MHYRKPLHYNNTHCELPVLTSGIFTVYTAAIGESCLPLTSAVG